MRLSLPGRTFWYLRWIGVDVCIVAASLLLAWAVRHVTIDRLVVPGPEVALFGAVAVAVYCGVNAAFRLYTRIWRYASAAEVLTIGYSVAIGTAVLVVDALLWPGGRPVPISVVPLMGLLAYVGFVGVRYRLRLLSGPRRHWWALHGQYTRARTRALVVGAGDAGQLLGWRFLNQKKGEGFDLVGFVDDDPSKLGMRVHGLPVLGSRWEIPAIVERYGVELIVFAIYDITGESFRELVEICEPTQAVIKVLPNLFDFLEGANGSARIRDVTAADLLGRRTTEVDEEACRRLVAGKTVLVTGAAGSIGSELCRQIVPLGPARLLMLDNNESGLYDLQMELGASSQPSAVGCQSSSEPVGEDPRVLPGAAGVECVLPIVADVTNGAKIEALFRRHEPRVVFHAAAYKHVPLMEDYPEEAVRVNVLGTRTVAETAARHGAERFVLVSTDKAINPSSVMGATKRAAEMLVIGE